MENKDLNVFEMINVISKDMDTKKDNTILKIEDIENEKIKQLRLKSGSWSAEKPWFVVDENQKFHTMMSINSVNKIVRKFRETQEENFNLKLEKVIWQNIPIDFDDVRAVAMVEIKNLIKHKDKDTQVIDVDLERLIKKIKTEHPNLFFNIKDLQVETR